MTHLTQDEVRTLAGFRADEAPVVSLYLDVDGRSHPRPRDYEAEFGHLLRRAKGPAGHNGYHPADKDLRKIESCVKAGFDRSRTRGVAIFSCTQAGLWRVIELPVSVRSRLTINQTPQVRQLEAVLDEYERFGVLLVDRQRTRLLVFELGQLVDKSELVDELPRHEDDGGEFERDHVRDHVAAYAHRHVRRAAQVAFAVHKDQPFDHLIVSAPDEMLNEVEHELHSYLRERIAARLSLPTTARDEDIRVAALDVEERLRRDRQAALITRLRDAVGAGDAAWVSGEASAVKRGAQGVVGLDPVLTAVVERRVETLVVSDGYEAPGWRCPVCQYLGTRGRRCPVCSEAMKAVDDVVEAAVEEALVQSCRIAVCAGNADLDVLGRIGALLRF